MTGTRFTTWMASRPATWACRGVAAGVLVAYVAVVAAALPPSERWFVHPDDTDVVRYAPAILDGGLPLVSADEFAPEGFEDDPWFVPPGSKERDDGRYATLRAPGFFYLLAPAAAAGPGAVFVAMDVLAVLSLAAVYLAAERLASPPAAVLALALLAFSPSALFWGWFPRSNLVAVGALALGLGLLASRRTGARVAGAAVLGLSPLLRFELLVPVAAVGLAWLVRAWPDLRAGDRAAWAVAGAAVAGLAACAAMWLLVYETLNVVAITRGADIASGDVVELTTATTRTDVLRAQLALYGPLLVPAGVLLAGCFLAPAGHWMVRPLAAGSLLLGAFFLATSFSEQDLFLLSSPVRYLLPALLGAALALAAVLRAAPLGVMAAAAVAVALLAVASAGAALGEDGLDGVGATTRQGRAWSEASAALPDDAVLVGEYVGNAVTDRPVLLPNRERNETARRAVLVDEVARLLGAGYTVFGAVDGSPHYRQWVASDGRFTVSTTPDGVWWQAQRR